MMTEPTPPTSPLSLLGWFAAHWQNPALRRLVWLGGGLVGVGVGVFLLWLADDAGGWVFALAGAWALGLAARVTGQAASVPDTLPRLTWREAVRVAEDPTMQFEPRPTAQPFTMDSAWFLRVFRWVALIILVVVGNMVLRSQTTIQSEPTMLVLGLGLWVIAGVGLVWALRQESALLDSAATSLTAPPQVGPWAMRVALLGGVVVAAGVAFWAAGGNRFSTLGVVAWLLAVGLWVMALWQGEVRVPVWRALNTLAETVTHGRTLHFRAVLVLVLGALLMGAYFRLAHIESIPMEMTSDHVEKLMDVADLMLAGEHKIFFERNTGREPLQFYWTALVVELFGTGITHVSLVLGTALLGLLMLPAAFLLGRELEDDAFGLLVLTLAAISLWHVAISRVGLRFPLYPLFVAPALYLVFRGLQRRSRNAFVLAGLVLGISLYGYSPIRVLPLAMLAVVGIYALWPLARGWRWHLLANTAMMFITAGLVFLPMLRYAFDQPDMFGFRMASRLVGEYDITVAGNPALIFWQNNLNALLMFHWRGDQVWVNTLPGQPVLDVVTGGLLVLGLGYAVMRLMLRRDWRMAALLVCIPILLLPSTLSLAFPEENPSVVRAGGVIPVIMALAAYPLWLTWQRVRTLPTTDWARPLVAVALAGVVAVATWNNYQDYFVRYPENYAANAQNASEIGAVARAFAESVGSYDTVAVRPYPHWVDTRAVGMYAGDYWANFPPIMHDYAIQFRDLNRWVDDPRAKLFILHPGDVTGERPDGGPLALPELRRLYPDGTLSRHASGRADFRDFYLYTVPATRDATLPLPPSP